MSETTQSVYEGVGRPEVQAKNIVDKIKSDWKTNTEKNLRDIHEKQVKKSEFKRLGKEYEQTQLNQFDKIVNALDEGQLKRVAQIVRPAAVLGAKAARLSAAAADIIISAVPTVIAFPFYMAGFGALSSEMTGGKKYSAVQVIGALGVGGAGFAIGSGIMYLSPVRRTGMWLAEKGGNMGERVAKWTNKILHKEPAAEAGPTQVQ